MRSGFFNDTEVWAEDFARFAAGLLTNGVLADDPDALKVTAAEGMMVQIQPGYCWINGHFGLAEYTEAVEIETADGTLPRIDRVVARLDYSGNKVKLHVITGTPAATPSAPPPVRNGAYYDIGLAIISLPAGAISVTAAMITDTRSDVNVCGAVLYRNADALALDGKEDKTAVAALSADIYSKITTINNNISSINSQISAATSRITDLETFNTNNGVKLLYSGQSSDVVIENASNYKFFVISVNGDNSNTRYSAVISYDSVSQSLYFPEGDRANSSTIYARTSSHSSISPYDPQDGSSIFIGFVTRQAQNYQGNYDKMHFFDMQTTYPIKIYGVKWG